MSQTETDEQIAILDYTRTSKGDLLVEALAGTGKTWTLLAALPALPARSILMSAFNKRIALELEARVPPMPKGSVVHIKTFHALGLSVLKSRFHGLEVNARATEDLVNDVAQGAPFPVRRAAVKLLRTLKEVQCELTPKREAIREVADRSGQFEKLTEPQIQQTLGIVVDAYARGMDFRQRKTIDFCDMVWGPIVCGVVPPSRYQAVIIDELQDISGPQFALLMMMIAPGGRVIGVGDKKQDIYQWRESLGSSAWDLIQNRKGSVGCMSMPLTMTFRCDHAIVREANALVPRLRARPDAGRGSVTTIHTDKLAATLGKPFIPSLITDEEPIHTFVLSRSNAQLLSCALAVWSFNVDKPIRFSINGGREIFEPLFEILDGLQTAGTPALFLGSLASWYRAEIAKAEAANAASRAERIEEHNQMLEIAAKYTTPNRIKRLLETLIGDGRTPILLSTVHKVKGLEADRVFLLKETFARHAGCRRCGAKLGSNSPAACSCGFDRDINQEELNIEYVAITRAKHELVWVTEDSYLGEDPSGGPDRDEGPGFGDSSHGGDE